MKLTKDYKLAYVEVLEVLKKLDKDKYLKIPKEKIELYQNYKDNEYVFDLDDTKEIKTQISKTSQIILANLFIKYIANEEDRKKINEIKRKQYWNKEESKKNIKLNPLFENKNNQDNPNSTDSNKALVIRNESLFKKILLKIKVFLKGNNYI